MHARSNEYTLELVPTSAAVPASWTRRFKSAKVSSNRVHRT